MVGVHRDETIPTAIGQITLLYDDAHFLKPKLLSLCLHIIEVQFREFLFLSEVNEESRYALESNTKMLLYAQHDLSEHTFCCSDSKDTIFSVRLVHEYAGKCHKSILLHK